MGFKFWTIRTVLGIVLGFGAGFVVQVGYFAFLAIHHGSLDAALSAKQAPAHRQLDDLAFFATFGAGPAGFMASFVGVLMVPADYTDRMLLRSWAMAALFGILIGGALGICLGLLSPLIIAYEVSILLALALGFVAGLMAAIFLRFRTNR
jgi:hypothetical protein